MLIVASLGGSEGPNKPLQQTAASRHCVSTLGDLIHSQDAINRRFNGVLALPEAETAVCGGVLHS